MDDGLKGLSDDLVCERCRRMLGPSQLACPRRGLPGSQGCSYTLTMGRAYPRPSGGLVLAGGLIAVGGLWVAWRADAAGNLAAGWAAAGLGVLLLWIWTWRQFSERSILDNPATGQHWEQVRLFGWAVARRATGAVRLLAWQGPPARVLRFPASVVEFYREGSTTDILAAALLQLAAQGAVVFGQQEEKDHWGRTRSRYLVQAGPGADGGVLDGWLEQHLMSIVRAGPAYGVTLSGLASGVLGQSNRFPRNVLVDRYVGTEAEALGLGAVQLVGMRKALNPAETARARIGRDLHTIRLLFADLWAGSPEFAREMLAELDRAVLKTAGPGQGDSSTPAASNRQ